MTLDLLDHTGLMRNLSLSIVYLHPEVDNANRCWGLWDEASCPLCPEFWNNMPKLMLRCLLAVFNLLLSMHLCACNSWQWKYFHCHGRHLCERQFLWKITSVRVLWSQEDFNVLKNKQDRRCYSKYRRSKSFFWTTSFHCVDVNTLMGTVNMPRRLQKQKVVSRWRENL